MITALPEKKDVQTMYIPSGTKKRTKEWVTELKIARLSFCTHIPAWPVQHTSLIGLVRVETLQKKEF
jgi:hypothetical protein